MAMLLGYAYGTRLPGNAGLRKLFGAAGRKRFFLKKEATSSCALAYALRLR
jgi:hypothetical protein